MPGGLDQSTTHRLTIDYEEDYRLIAAVFDALGGGAAGDSRVFSSSEIVGFLDAHPEIARLNARFRGTGWIDQHRHELRTARQAPGDTSRANFAEVTP